MKRSQLYYDLERAGVPQKEIAQRFGVTVAAVCNGIARAVDSARLKHERARARDYYYDGHHIPLRTRMNGNSDL